MKLLLTSLLLGLCVVAIAQQSPTSNFRMSINDDDKTMAIEVEGAVNGSQISYNRRFQIAGMSSAEKDALKTRVLDSLGLSTPSYPPVPRVTRVTPVPPVPPVPPAENGRSTVQLVCESCAGNGKITINGDGFSLERESRNEGKKPMFPMEVDLEPGEYRYLYWQNGVLQMQQPFTVKAGEKNVVKVK